MPKNDLNQVFSYENLLNISKDERLEWITNLINRLSLSELEFAKKRINEAQMKRFFLIPDEILVYVFSLISDINDLNCCRLTCKRWNRILKENMIWKTVCYKNGFYMNSIFNYNRWNRIFKFNYLTAKNWKRGNFSLRHRSIDPGSTSGICTSFDDQWVASLNFRDIGEGRVWNYHTGEEKVRIFGHTSSISSVQFNKEFIVSGSVDSTLKVWDWSGNCLETLRGHTKEITCLHITKDHIISGSEDQTVKIWRISSRSCETTLKWHSKSIICLAVYKDLIFAGSADKTLSIWDLDSRTLKRVLVGHAGAVQCVCVNSDLIVSGSEDTTIRIWNSNTGNCRVLSGHSSLVICLLIDKGKIISGSADTSIKVWDIKSGYCMYTLKNHTSPVWNLYATSNSLISSAFDQSLLEFDFSHVED